MNFRPKRTLFTLVFLLFLSFLTYYLYSPILGLFFEGDDLIVLWHLRNPVSFVLKPFLNWSIPIAGRYSYGQIWYESLLYNIWHLNSFYYNLSGLIIRIFTIIVIYFTSRKITKNTLIAVMSAVLFTFLSTGIESTYYVFHHVHFVFLSFVLIGFSYIFEYFESGKFWPWISSLLFLFIAGYLYTIRVAGLILLPIYSLIRILAVSTGRRKIKYITMSVFTTILLFLLIFLTVKDVRNVSSAIRDNLLLIFYSKNGEFLLFIQPFLVSLGRMIFPTPFTNAITVPLYRTVLIFSVIVTVCLPVYEIIRFFGYKYVDRSFYKGLIFKLILFCLGVLWILVFGYLKIINYSYFYTNHSFLLATIGFYTILICFYVGISNFYTHPKIASLLLISILTLLGFYIPNWLFAPTVYSNTESRYFSSSSVFLSLGFSCLAYLVISTFRNFLESPVLSIFKPVVFCFNLIIIFGLVFFVYIHFEGVKSAVFEQTKFRNTEKILNNWNTVRSNVNFEKHPVVIFLWTRTDIVRIMKMFFGKETFGLVGDLPFEHELPVSVINYEEAASFICEYERSGNVFDYQNYYEFELDKDDVIVSRLDDGRRRLKSWRNYCQDSKVLGEPLPLNLNSL